MTYRSRRIFNRYKVNALINPQPEKMRLDRTSKQMGFGSQDLPEHFSTSRSSTRMLNLAPEAPQTHEIPRGDQKSKYEEHVVKV